MNKYDFRLILRGVEVMTEDLAERLYESGCDDGSPGSSEGVAMIDFHRKAESLESAIRSAVADVSRAGCTAARVEIDLAAAS